MGRKDFIADLHAASNAPPIPSIGNLQRSDDGESFTFHFNHTHGGVTTVTAFMTGTTLYPLPWKCSSPNGISRLTRFR